MIKTMIFDMGNVLINFSYKIAAQHVSQMCRAQPERIKEFLFDSGLHYAYETGKFTGLEIYERFKEAFPGKFSPEDLKQAACSMFWPKPEMEEIARNLRDQGYHMILLSNICDIHFDFIKAQYQFPAYFDHWVLSYEVGFRKPDPEIYRKALALAEAPAEKCFFIDDMKENVEAACGLGIKGHHFREVPVLKEALNSYGISC